MPTVSIHSTEVRFLSERDWRLAHLISRIGNLEYRKADSAFLNITHSIIEQMMSMKAASKIEGRLLDLCGGSISPNSVAAQTLDNIKSCGISLRKAQSLKNFAEYSRQNDPERLANKTENEIRRELTSLPGIGKWRSRRKCWCKGDALAPV